MWSPDGKAEKTFAARTVTVEPRRSKTIELAETWANPTLWWPDAPHLYWVVTTLKQDGRIIDVLLSSTPLDHQELSQGVIFTALDITERKQAEETIASLANIEGQRLKVLRGGSVVQIDAGVDALIIHARKAWLQGLSPKQNREVPLLNYEWVYRLKQLYPATEFIINGGIKTLDECEIHLNHVDGVMLGREPYARPFLLAEVDQRLFGEKEKKAPSRQQILERYLTYIEDHLAQGIVEGQSVFFHALTNRFQGCESAVALVQMIDTGRDSESR